MGAFIIITLNKHLFWGSQTGNCKYSRENFINEKKQPSENWFLPMSERRVQIALNETWIRGQYKCDWWPLMKQLQFFELDNRVSPNTLESIHKQFWHCNFHGHSWSEVHLCRKQAWSKRILLLAALILTYTPSPYAIAWATYHGTGNEVKEELHSGS